MAKIDMGILGGFSGRVGPVVGYRRHGKWFVRAYQPKINDRKSASQLAQRTRFLTMIRFASPATPALRVGLRQAAEQQGLTEGNIFLKINKECFPRETRNTRETRNSSIDYPRLRFSLGSLAAPSALQYTVDQRNTISVSWSREGGRLADRIHLYIYCPDAATGLCATGERGRRGLQLLLPQEFAGQELHVWAFSENAHGEVSRTAYAAHPSLTSQPTEHQENEHLTDTHTPISSTTRSPLSAAGRTTSPPRG